MYQTIKGNDGLSIGVGRLQHFATPQDIIADD
jgi:hypothetical protein